MDEDDDEDEDKAEDKNEDEDEDKAGDKNENKAKKYFFLKYFKNHNFLPLFWAGSCATLLGWTENRATVIAWKYFHSYGLELMPPFLSENCATSLFRACSCATVL